MEDFLKFVFWVFIIFIVLPITCQVAECSGCNSLFIWSCGGCCDYAEPHIDRGVEAGCNATWNGCASCLADDPPDERRDH